MPTQESSNLSYTWRKFHSLLDASNHCYDTNHLHHIIWEIYLFKRTIFDSLDFVPDSLNIHNVAYKLNIALCRSSVFPMWKKILLHMWKYILPIMAGICYNDQSILLVHQVFKLSCCFSLLLCRSTVDMSMYVHHMSTHPICKTNHLSLSTLTLSDTLNSFNPFRTHVQLMLRQ